MTVKKLLIFVTSTVLISNFLSTSMVLASDDNPPDFLRNLPPWEIYEEPPQRIFAPPPVYVDVDAAGNFVTKVVKMTRSGGYEISGWNACAVIAWPRVLKTRSGVGRAEFATVSAAGGAGGNGLGVPLRRENASNNSGAAVVRP